MDFLPSPTQFQSCIFHEKRHRIKAIKAADGGREGFIDASNQPEPAVSLTAFAEIRLSLILEHQTDLKRELVP